NLRYRWKACSSAFLPKHRKSVDLDGPQVCARRKGAPPTNKPDVGVSACWPPPKRFHRSLVALPHLAPFRCSFRHMYGLALDPPEGLASPFFAKEAAQTPQHQEDS